MKLKLLFLLLILTWPLLAQEKKSIKHTRHRINVSYTPQAYLNYFSVKHSGFNYNQQVVYPKEITAGHAFGLEYQYITRYGLIMSLGAQLGRQECKVRQLYNLGYVDDAVPELKNLTVDTTTGAKVRYASIRLMAGYRWASPIKRFPGLDIEVKAGITARHYLDYSYNYFLQKVAYRKNDTLFIIQASDNSMSYGKSQPFGSGFTYAGDVYFGVSQNVQLGVLRSFSIGIEATHALGRYGNAGSTRVLLMKYNQGTEQMYDIGEYAGGTQDFSIGLRLTLGLWP